MKKLLIFSVICLICLLFFKNAFPKKAIHPTTTLSQIGIVKTEQIKIPGYPKAFNPSLIPYKKGYLLSFRVRHRTSSIKTPLKSCFRSKDVSFIGVAQLDKEFKVKKAQLLDISSYGSCISSTAEDARLLNFNGKILIFFNDFPPSQARGAYALYCGELIETEGLFSLKAQAALLQYEHAKPIEKNWSPFVSENQLYLIYSDQPRIILNADLETGICTEVARSASNWEWNWGEIRGGTPAELIDDEFITFFHSSAQASTEKQTRVYLMGAYTFDKAFPFSPKTATPIPIGKSEDYTKNNRHQVVFPCGICVKDGLIHTTWGKNNKEMFITTFDQKELLRSMSPYRANLTE